VEADTPSLGGTADLRAAPTQARDQADQAPAHPRDAAAAVSALYQTHAVGLIRLAVVMLGDRAAAEDVVQDAFIGLYRSWSRLADTSNALGYVRSSVLNRCRSEFRRRMRAERRAARQTAPNDAASAEVMALISEEHREVLLALRRLPPRQREALVLRFYLDLPVPEIAAAMGVTEGTVKSTTSRGLGALGQLLKEDKR
jgi:RNA polymerase sigma-70 factor (sigma-E family)